jgi:hypothetical protein
VFVNWQRLKRPRIPKHHLRDSLTRPGCCKLLLCLQGDSYTPSRQIYKGRRG